MEIIYTGAKKGKYRLKIKKADYLELAKAISKVLESEPDIRQKYKNEGLSDERFRWDMLWESCFDTNLLYSYLNDSHIDTALRHILN